MMHPNAFAAAVVSGITLAAVHFLQHHGYARMTDEQAIALGGGATTTVLFLGKRFLSLGGLRGILRLFWRGKPPAAAS